MKRLILVVALGTLLISFLAAQTTGWATWQNLTPQQTEAYQKLYQKFVNEINPLQTQLDTYYAQLRSLNFQTTPNHEKIINIRKKIVLLDDTIGQKILDYRLEALSLLTKEQIVTLPSDCTLGFWLPGNGFGYGLGYGRGYYQRPGWGRGMGYGRGYYRGPGWGRGMGYGRGYYGRGAGWGRGMGYGRGYYRGSGWGRGWGYDGRQGFRRPISRPYYWRKN